jgi:aryl-alcohol dehydrogenase-like predicted oxidoreductase
MLVRDIEKEILPACEKLGLGILPYFPLAHGFLTGKYRRGEPVPEGTRLALTPAAQGRRLTDENFEVLEKLEAFVKARGKTLVDLAFAWLLSRKAVSSVIAGASNAEQVAQNAAASGWVLNAEEVASSNGRTPMWAA